MAKPSIKSTAIAYAVQAVEDYAYENVNYYMSLASLDIRKWWNGLSNRTQNNYARLVLNLREQGHFRNERTPYFYSLGLDEFFTADAEPTEVVEAEEETPAVSADEVKIGENLYQIEVTVEAVFTDMDNENLVFIRVTRDSAPTRASKLKFNCWTFRTDARTNPYRVGDRVRLTIHINHTGSHTTASHELIEDTPGGDDPTPADTNTAPDSDDDDVRMFSYMRGELNDMEAQAEAQAADEVKIGDTADEMPLDNENHGDLAIELPQEYAVFNLHGKYEELANAMHDRLEKQFRLTTDLFGDSDEPVTIADIDDILDAEAYEGWNVFVDGWWDNELRLYAQRADADSEDATPSLYSDWVMIDADHGYLTIGTPV